ncbi:Charged multivesicular body protein 1b [Bonamia ostreae]|uniref:Charged multivesicular body protein 1b n=1 Tax=Bonamia ostreae TaxID=126728 RepID=A0ABV2ATN4_9EUKA
MAKKIEENLFNLKFAAKQYEREARRFEKRARAERIKIKTYIERGDIDSATVHSENAIKFKNQSVRYLALSSRVESAYNTVNSAVNMQMVTKSMKGIVRALESSADLNDMDKMTDTMDKFEKECENANIRTDYMEQAMTAVSSRTMRKEQAQELMQRVADEHGLEFSAEMEGVGVPGRKKETGNKELEERLKRLQEL